MFQVYCPAHRAHVLLSERRILVLVPTAEGLMMDWRCWCGHRGRSLTGRGYGADTAPTDAAAAAPPAGGRDDTGRRPPRLPAAS